MEGVHRLEGSSGGAGGLVIKKKNSNKEESSNYGSSFKSPPKGSILGLDKLAAAKRTQQVILSIFLNYYCMDNY
jgi:hypothetical protein